MKNVSVRELKAKASALLRKVAEEGATYTVTRHGRPAGVLAAPGYTNPATNDSDRKAWDRLLALADDEKRPASRRGSAVRELSRMRR